MLFYYFKLCQSHNNMHILSYELRVISIVLFKRVYKCKQNNDAPDKVCIIPLIFQSFLSFISRHGTCKPAKTGRNIHTGDHQKQLVQHWQIWYKNYNLNI